MTSCSVSAKKLSSRLEFRMSMLLPLDFAIVNAPTFNSHALLTALVMSGVTLFSFSAIACDEQSCI